MMWGALERLVALEGMVKTILELNFLVEMEEAV